MRDRWASALAEFAASTAAINARALHRAGIIQQEEASAMHAFLVHLEVAAKTDPQKSIVRSLRGCLPPAPELH